MCVVGLKTYHKLVEYRLFKKQTDKYMVFKSKLKGKTVLKMTDDALKSS